MESRTNVAIYIDYENIHKSLLRSNTNILRTGFFEKIRIWCAQNNKRIVQTLVYCNFDNEDLYQSHHQTTLQNYGVETIHTSNQGKNYADLKISIDVLTSMYSNSNIDEFIIVSNDKDMVPLLNSIRANKRNVCLITAGKTYNRAICEFADQHISLEDICTLPADRLIISDVKEKFFESFYKYVSEKIDAFNSGCSYPHYALEYNIKKSVPFFKMMSYELLTMVKDLHEEGKLLFYTYDYGGKAIPAILPTDKKLFFLDNGITFEDRIVEDYDIDRDIRQEYAKYAK